MPVVPSVVGSALIDAANIIGSVGLGVAGKGSCWDRLARVKRATSRLDPSTARAALPWPRSRTRGGAAKVSSRMASPEPSSPGASKDGGLTPAAAGLSPVSRAGAWRSAGPASTGAPRRPPPAIVGAARCGWPAASRRDRTGATHASVPSNAVVHSACVRAANAAASRSRSAGHLAS